jgi:Rad3-related DNA helicase
MVLNRNRTLLFEEGRARPGKGESDLDEIPKVVYRVEANKPAAIDILLLARTLHPTLSDHTIASLCHHYNMPFAKNKVEEAVGALFTSLLTDALQLDPDLLSLLSQLLPNPTGNLLARAIPHTRLTSPPPPQETPTPPVPIISLEEAMSRVAEAMASFEDRPGQRKMSTQVSRTLEKGGTLVVEAGPGTGKTFAYLVPALLHLKDHPKTRLVLSTRTKQLQEQIYHKDLPFLFPLLSPQIKVALLKGRRNYLCLRRWQMVLGEVIEGLEQDLLPLLAPLARWLFQTKTGDIEENGVFLSDPRSRELWNRLYDDPPRCLGPVCQFYDDCFSIAARRRAKRADLVVVNHSLLLRDQQAEPRILGDYASLIVDEAHSLEGAARHAFTETLSQRTLEGPLREIEHSPGRHPGGWIARIPLARSDARVTRIRELQEPLRKMNARFFSELARTLPPEKRGFLPETLPKVESLLQTATALKIATEAVANAIDSQEEKHEAEGLSEEIGGIIGLFSLLFSPPAENTVHWYSRERDEVFLHASPLDIAPLLAERLYPKLEGIILTSATLSLGEGFQYIDESLGLPAAPGETTCSVVESPFNYEDRMRLYLPVFFPPVTGSLEESAEAIATCARASADATGRKVLVLFTSYRLLHAVHEIIGDGRDVFAQGIDGPRSKVIERFKRAKGAAILLGTDSFWEGVDFPGSDLEILIITRLPFPVPTDPVFSALGERLSAAGKDAFLDLSLPQAILKLRQGVGRLIRTKDDHGAVIITDQRILQKGYGKLFTAALPVPGRKVGDLDDFLCDLGTWFTGQSR